MATNPIDIVTAAFDKQSEFDAAHAALKTASKDKQITVYNIAQIRRDQDGKVHFSETRDAGAGRGALYGAAAGALVGLVLGGPVGGVVGFLAATGAGAALGAGAAKLTDAGIEDARLEAIGSMLKGGEFALVVVADPKDTEWIKSTFKTLGADALAIGLTEDTAIEIGKAMHTASN
jgi:uncharacterized membrane protein